MKNVLFALTLLMSFSSYSNEDFEKVVVKKVSIDTLKLHYSNSVCTVRNNQEWDNRLGDFVFDTTELSHFEGDDMIGKEKVLNFPKAIYYALNGEGHCSPL